MMTKHTGRRQFRIVLAYEFMSYMRNKVYIGITLAFVILIAIGLSVPALIAALRDAGLGRPDDQVKPGPEQAVHVIDESGMLHDLADLGNAMPDIYFTPAQPDQLETLTRSVSEGQARAVLHLQDLSRYTLIERRASGDLYARLSQFLGRQYKILQLAEAGLNDDQINTVLSDPDFRLVETVAESGKTMQQTYFYTYLLLFLLYMTVMMYGQLVATSVASEKSNRAMEMLITSARPMSLMFGKVIGSGLAGLVQIGILMAAAAAAYAVNRQSWADIPFVRSIFQMPPVLVVFTVICYLLGYFMYAFLYGALGSLASRTEDINTSIMPVILVIMVAMFIAMFGMMAPESSWLTTFSFVPFTAPMALFVRISMTEVPAWQIALSTASMLATIYLTGWVSSRIYRLGVLMYGKPPKIPDLIRMLRQANQ